MIDIAHKADSRESAGSFRGTGSLLLDEESMELAGNQYGNLLSASELNIEACRG